MRKINFDVPIYNWNITIVTLYDKNDYESLKQLLEDIDAQPEEDKENCLQGCLKGAVNGGDTWYDNDMRKQLVILYPWTSESRFIEVLNHEKSHIVWRIMKHAGVRDNEATAYLDGYISKMIFNRINELR